MITGYNTDVRHQDVVFHVQTEDKGAGNPMIESLVYVGGQVLAARRASYSDLLAKDEGDQAVLERMDRQHRTMIAAIRSGRFDTKVADLLGHGARSETASVGGRAAEPAPSSAASTAAAAAPAVELSVPERTLDQVILEYLTSEAEQEQLVLDLEDQADVALGQRAYLALRARSSKSGEAVGGAQVTVKMISTVDEPQALAHGATDGGGALRLVFDIPPLERGTAALIITAASAIGRAELKQLL